MANRRFCSKCGAPLDEGDLFCPECNEPYVLQVENPQTVSGDVADREPSSTQKEVQKSEDNGETAGGNLIKAPTGTKVLSKKTLLFVIGALMIAMISAVITIVAKGQSKYEVVIKDCTWKQAFEESLESGGHLVTIETEKEYKHLISLLSDAELDSVRLYISAARDNDDDKYYWIDKDMYFVGDALNGEKSYAKEVWKSGNPSLVNSEDTSIVENRVELQHTTSFQWDYNDVADNILDADPAWAGKIGYIIEYD